MVSHLIQEIFLTSSPPPQKNLQKIDSREEMIPERALKRRKGNKPEWRTERT
jgi:hypothetical protein